MELGPSTLPLKDTMLWLVMIKTKKMQRSLIFQVLFMMFWAQMFYPLSPILYSSRITTSFERLYWLFTFSVDSLQNSIDQIASLFQQVLLHRMYLMLILTWPFHLCLFIQSNRFVLNIFSIFGFGLSIMEPYLWSLNNGYALDISSFMLWLVFCYKYDDYPLV